MRTQHFFVPVLDVGELLPFSIKTIKDIKKSMAEQERARTELEKFIDLLEKMFKEKIFYMGMDVIEAKTYERFMFEKGGFLEIMMETPLALNAHFVEEKRAKSFSEAIKKTFQIILKNDSVTKMLIDSISPNSEHDDSLTYEKWDIMKHVKGK
jgi:hypothetical protein